MASIKIETDDGVFDLDIRIGDMRRFEKEYGITLADLEIPEGQPVPPNHVDKFLFLAYCAAKRTKQTELPFDDWCDTITSLGGFQADPLDRSIA